MYQNLPYNYTQILLDYNEFVLAVHNMPALRNYLSGQAKYEQFCVVTSERVYSYSCNKGINTASIHDIDSIEKITIDSVKKSIKLLRLLYTLPCLAGCFLMVKLFLYACEHSTLSSAFGIVFFFLIALLLGIFALFFLIKTFTAWKREQHAVMCLHINDGTELRAELRSLATREILTFENALKSAQYSRKSGNDELFLP